MLKCSEIAPLPPRTEARRASVPPSRGHSVRALVMIACLALPSFAAAQAQQFRIRRDGGSRVTFVSDAPLETINGVSSQISGNISIDPSRLASASATVTVPISSLRTGIDLRDEHLRAENWLDAEHHPNITFELTGLSGASALQPGQSANVRIRGRVSLHGVTKNIEARGRVMYMPLTDEMRASPGIDGDVLRFRARFKLRLTDFGVAIPLPVRLKVSNEITISINARAIAES